MSASFDRVPAWPADVPSSHVPSSHWGEGTLTTRYEDISQDGRIGLRPLSHGIGAAVWRASLRRHPSYGALFSAGIIPILSRMVVAAGGGPIAVAAAVRAQGTFVSSRAEDASGEARLRLDMWARMDAPRGRTWGPPPEGAGETIPLGTMYAEHVLTRPFATRPEDRKVTSLPSGVDLAMRDERWHPPHELLEQPAGARFEGDEWTDTSVTVFGLGHTDSNQHVNSLVYPLLVEEAALRFCAERGIAGPHFADFIEMRFRKPFFAGEACRVVLRAYRRERASGEVLGVVARLAPASGAAPERAHAYAHLELVA